MLDYLKELDKALLLALNGSDSLLMDGIVWTLTNPFSWLPLYVCLLYIVIKNNTMRNALIIIFLTILLIVITDQFSSSFCKPYFHRLRPSRNPSLQSLIDITNGYRGGRYGFFSSHASNIFGLTVFYSLLIRNWKFFFNMMIVCIVMCYTRLYLGVHYPSDIFVGTIFGSLCGMLIYLTYRFIDKRINTQRSFYSSAYTSSGYIISDIYILQASLSICFLYAVFRGTFYAAVF